MVQVVQTVPVVPMVQVIRLVRVVQVVRCSGDKVVQVATQDDMLSENIWFSCPKLLNN